MHVLKWEGRGPKFTTALVTGLLAVGATVALGAPQAYAAPKAKGASTTTTTSSTTSSTTLVTPSTTLVPGKQSRITAPAPTTTSTTSTTATSTTSTTATAAAPDVKVDKVGKVNTKLSTPKASTVPTSTTVPGQAEATTTVPSLTTTTTTSTATSTTTTSRPGRTTVTRAETQALVTTRVPGQCGRTPSGPVTNGETITTTGTVTLTTPVILDHCTDVTFNGGTWIDPNTSPGKAYGGGVGNGRPSFDIIGGSNITVENLRINGANKGGAYRTDLAFNSGIWTDGTADLTVSNVRVAHVFGDCLTLAPLRSGRNMNGIVAPVRNLTVDQFTANACGRQGIALSSVDGAVLTNITVGTTAFDAFDAEADQPGKEGAMNVTVNGCSFGGLIAIKAGGGATGPITFSNCTMTGTGAGSVLSVFNSSGRPDAGPITFSNDSLRCGASAYVSCFQLNGATDTRVENSIVTIGYHQDKVHESAYDISGGTHITFADDVVKGFGKLGRSFGSSTATVTGGTWAAQSCQGSVVCPGR